MLFAEVLRRAMFGVFDYSSRSERLEQWTFAFLTAIGTAAYLFALDNGVRLVGPFLWLMLFIGCWVLMAHIALMVRRLHDHDVSGFFLLIPLTGLCIMAAGYFGRIGHVEYFGSLMRDYGIYIQWAGRIICSLSGAYLLTIFIGEGTPKENRFGDPV